MSQQHFISLQYRGHWDYAEPHRSIYNLSDIARGLSNTCRFAGHVPRFYSVAEHSILVADLVTRYHEKELLNLRPEVIAYALLHDAGEAFSGDFPTPLKERFPEFKAFSDETQDVIMTRYFGSQWRSFFTTADHDLIAQADEMALLVEARTFFPQETWWRERILAWGASDSDFELSFGPDSRSSFSPEEAASAYMSNFRALRAFAPEYSDALRLLLTEAW